MKDGYHPDPRPTEELVKAALSEENSAKYWITVELLQYRGTDEVFEIAVRLSQSENPRERELSADILGGVGARDWLYGRKSVDLLTSLLGDPDEDVLASAATALGLRFRAFWPKKSEPLELEEVLGSLLSLSGSSNADVRESVAFALGWAVYLDIQPQMLGRVIDALVILSADRKRPIRELGTNALAYGKVQNDAVMEALYCRIHDRDGEIRGEALLGLAIKGDPRSVDLIQNELSTRKPIFDDTLNAAGETHDSRLLPVLLQLKENGITSDSLDEAIEACSTEKKES